MGNRKPASADMLPTSQLIGQAVVSPTGRPLGSITDLLFHLSAGRISFAALAGPYWTGGCALVPWFALAWSPDAEQLVLDVPHSVLGGALILPEGQTIKELGALWEEQAVQAFDATGHWVLEKQA